MACAVGATTKHTVYLFGRYSAFLPTWNSRQWVHRVHEQDSIQELTQTQTCSVLARLFPTASYHLWCGQVQTIYAASYIPIKTGLRQTVGRAECPPPAPCSVHSEGMKLTSLTNEPEWCHPCTQNTSEYIPEHKWKSWRFCLPCSLLTLSLLHCTVMTIGTGWFEPLISLISWLCIICVVLWRLSFSVERDKSVFFS